MIEFVLGVRHTHKGLRVDPCLPKALPNVTVEKEFRGKKYIYHRN